jgi:hypothetical protein
MTTTAIKSAAGERINYEVVWGPDEANRILYVDYGDGSWLSQDAETRAVRKLLELTKAGARVGLYENGTLAGGQEPIWPAEDEPEPVEHKTRTFLLDPGMHMNWRKGRLAQHQDSKAVCTCGWSADRSDRSSAQRAAKLHREGD